MAALGVRAFNYDPFCLNLHFVLASAFKPEGCFCAASRRKAGTHRAHNLNAAPPLNEIAAVLQDAAQAAPLLLLKLFRKIVIRLDLGDKAKSIGSWLF